MNNPNPFQHLADLIPEQERADLIEAVNRTYLSPTLNWEDVKLIFRIWNNHVSPTEPQDMNCRGCRSKVIGKLRNVVELWKNEG